MEDSFKAHGAGFRKRKLESSWSWLQEKQTLKAHGAGFRKKQNLKAHGAGFRKKQFESSWSWLQEKNNLKAHGAANETKKTLRLIDLQMENNIFKAHGLHMANKFKKNIVVNWENTLKTHGSKHGKHIYTVNIHLYIYMIDIPVKKIWHKQQYTKYLSLLATIDTLGP